MLVLVGGLSLVIAWLFDVLYFIRGVLCGIKWRLTVHSCQWIAPLTESEISSICTTNDLDFLCHMNNARYLRECDFGRYKLFLQNGIFHTVSQMGGKIVLGASAIRYRRSLNLYQRFLVKSQIICWDTTSMYVEQKVIRQSDGFICAIIVCKQSLIGPSPELVLRTLLGGNGLQSPPFPREIQAWIEYNNISSKTLRGLAE